MLIWLILILFRMFAANIVKLTRQLYPTGRAFKFFSKSYLEAIHTALGEVEAKSYRDAVSTLDSLLPDNDGFSAEDATDWERRLGMITNNAVSLDDRKLAIKRKLAFPSDRTYRQHWTFLESQLQAAGFNVYVHENLDDYPPEQVITAPNTGQMGVYQLNEVQLGGVYSLYSNWFSVIQHGSVQMGSVQMGSLPYFNNKLVNYINKTLDANFNVGNNFRSTFFIGGDVKGEITTVPATREEEFRQLILKIKPAQTVVYLLINYI